ncbi:MAG TPA: DUF1552 domain-containing protein [Prosthecobacter sp.]|nr:DUF1552 domain-containing protein [Prosthecobacter sp.]
MSRFQPLHRRGFLRGVGATLALPWLEMMLPAGARAAAKATPPLRFVTLFQPNGVFPDAWDVKGEGRDFALSTILQPLADFRDDMIVVSGVDSVGKGHVQLTAAFLTGTELDHGRNGVSLDQHIARQIGGGTRFPSIQLGTEPPRQGAAGDDPISLANTVSWSSPTTRISPEINPRAAFDRLFRDPASPEARREAINRKSVVDLVLEDAKALQRRAGGRDRQKIDEYLDGVRSVEVQLDRALNPPEPEWTPLAPPQMNRPAEGIPKRRDEHMRLMIDILVLALQTDTTRVGTFMTAHGFSRQNFTFLDGVTNDHHGMSHHKRQPQLVAEYTTVSRWYAQQVAYFLGKMRAVDEGQGTLLDNSIVLYGSEMKDGNGHIKTDLPLVLAGRGQGRLTPGRHVRAPKGTPLANLHLTLLQKFGADAPDFNGASTGTIAGLL